MSLLIALPRKARAARRNLEEAHALGHLNPIQTDFFMLLEGLISAVEQDARTQAQARGFLPPPKPPPYEGEV